MMGKLSVSHTTTRMVHFLEPDYEKRTIHLDDKRMMTNL